MLSFQLTALVSAILSTASAEPLVAVVVVDEEAREEGYALEIDGWLVEDALPVDVAEGEVLELVDPDGRVEPLDVQPGEAWEVTGPKGEAWMSLLDDEIRTDLIAVKGSPKSVDALAAALDADIVLADGTVYLKARDVLLDAAWVEDELALQIDEVELVRVRKAEEPEASDTPTPASTPSRSIHRAAAAAAAIGVRPAARPVAEAPASKTPAVSGTSTVDAPEAPVAAAPTVDDVEPFSRDPRAVGEAAYLAYAGDYQCRNETLWLNAGGSWVFRGVSGSWRMVSPGVVRMESWTGELWWRAGIQDGHCRDVWSPMGEGFTPPNLEPPKQRRGKRRGSR
jgi:hypothetical protein